MLLVCVQHNQSASSPLDTTWTVSHRLKHKALENLRRKSWNRDPGQAAQCPKHRFFRVLRDGSHATMCYTPHEPTLVYVRLLRYSNDAIRPLTTYIRGTPYEEWCHQIPYAGTLIIGMVDCLQKYLVSAVVPRKDLEM